MIPDTEPVLIVTRFFDAPRDLVFQAWTDPRQVGLWWGPRGFTTTTYSMDVRPGGVWSFMMHGPDGTDYPNRIVYTEVTRPERLVYAHGGGDEAAPPEFHVTVTFTEREGKTELTMRSLFPSLEARNRVLPYAVPGAHSTLDRLEEHLKGPAEPVFRLSRVFDAPRDLVWKAFTEPERLMRWWGPKGMTMEVARVDLRPGGTFHFCLKAPDGSLMWAKWTFVDVAAPERIVHIQSFSDENGGVTRYAMSPDWPLEMLNTLTFIERDGKTLFTLTVEAHNATDTERQTFAAGFDSMTGGFTGTFDQLDEYLASLN